jgi:hypothetical protein
VSEVPTYAVRLYIAGDVETAKRWLRHECWREGLCVTIEPTTFIYTGGEEDGFVVGFVNYPRFPTDPAGIWVERGSSLPNCAMSADNVPRCW